MYKYRLRSGKFHTKHPKTGERIKLSAGDILTTKKPLSENIADLFERIIPEDEAQKQKAQQAAQSGDGGSADDNKGKGDGGK